MKNTSFLVGILIGAAVLVYVLYEYGTVSKMTSPPPPPQADSSTEVPLQPSSSSITPPPTRRNRSGPEVKRGEEKLPGNEPAEKTVPSRNKRIARLAAEGWNAPRGTDGGGADGGGAA